MWDAFFMTEYSMMSVLSLNVSICQRKLWRNLSFSFRSLVLIQYCCLAGKMALTCDEAFPCIYSQHQWHMVKTFPGSTTNSDPLSPGCPCCGPEVLHKKGQILIFFLRRLWIFLSGVSSWSQTHLSLLSVCQKESYFLVSKEDALFLFQSLSLSFPDHMMLEDQLSCLSSHLP